VARLTLLDIAKANGSDAVAGLIDETVKAHPELTIGAARTISGINYETLVRTGLFNGSTFRTGNTGATVGKGTYENRLVDTFILNPRWEADKAIADAYEDGAPAYIAMEAESMVEKATVDLCAQFYYGRNATFGNASGFPGLIDSYDATNNVIDALGTTDSVATSVWLVKFGPKHVTWVWGQNGQLLVPDPRIETIFDANNKPLTGYVQDLLARPGLQVGSVRSTVRIKKLTTDSGKGLTDSLISQALAKFEVGVVPDVIFMSRRSRQQLQQSRSVTIFSGLGTKATATMENVAPLPETAFGIPIAVTDAIKETETLAL
jgi:hypothetical protein